MQKIGDVTPTANPAGEFTEGNPAAGAAATLLKAGWFNTIQRELLAVLAAAGITPDKTNDAQIVDAIAAIAAKAAPAATESVAGIAKVATEADFTTGTNDSKFATVKKINTWFAATMKQATETAFGWVKIATSALTNSGTDDATAVTPKKAAAAIQKQVWTAFSTGGTGGALTLTPSPAVTAYAAKQRFCVTFSTSSTGNDTLNVSDLGAKSLKQYDASGAKIAAVYAAGQISDVVFDGTDFVVLNPVAVTDYWAQQPIGVPIAVLYDIDQLIPPTNVAGYRYVKLTASDAYNTGVLTGESVTGVAPLVLATATVSLASSPLMGVSLSLINTERRSLRAGAARTLQSDAFQGSLQTTRWGDVTGFSGAGGTNLPYVGASSKATTTGIVTDGVNGTPRYDTETRVKNIGVTYFMRIK